MAAVKPGLESEQQDDEDSRENKEGRTPRTPSALRSPLLLTSFMPLAKHAHLCVTLHPGCSHIRWRGGGVIISAIRHVGVGVD